MTYHDLYVADVDDPNLKQDGGNWSGNCPGGLEGGLIYCKDDIAAFNKVLGMIGTTIPGEQTDWGCWVGKVSKDELRTILNEVGAWMNHGFLETLDDDKTYLLVARET